MQRRPYVACSEDGPGHETECNARSEDDLWRHHILLVDTAPNPLNVHAAARASDHRGGGASRSSGQCQVILRPARMTRCSSAVTTCTSWLCRDRAEELRPVHDSRLRKATSGERLRNALLWLTRVYSEAECEGSTRLEHAPYLLQSRACIRPHLHRLDCERPIKRLVWEW